MGWWEYISCAVIWTKWCNILYSGLFFALLHLQFISFHLKFDQRVVFQFINTLKEKFTQFRIRPLMIGEKGAKYNGMNISLYTVIYYMCFPFEIWKEFFSGHFLCDQIPMIQKTIMWYLYIFNGILISQRLKIELRDRDLLIADMRSQMAAQRVSELYTKGHSPAQLFTFLSYFSKFIQNVQ